jgi:hypothetical protein
VRTIPRHFVKGSRDYRVRCGICGVPWLRSRMRRDPDDGRLRCPDDANGDEAATLNRKGLAAIGRERLRGPSTW